MHGIGLLWRFVLILVGGLGIGVGDVGIGRPDVGAVGRVTLFRSPSTEGEMHAPERLELRSFSMAHRRIRSVLKLR